MLYKMMYNALFFFLLLALLWERAEGYWRMRCEGPSGIGQMDPIISPGKTSAHVHTVKGASGFGVSTDVEKLLASKCTSCTIKEDKSAYWTPQLYFFDKGTNQFEMVPEIGGSAVYYKNVPAGTSKGIVKPVAIPNGMQMVSGNSFRRNFTLAAPDPPRPWTGGDATQDALQQKAIGFNCLNYAGKAEDTLMRHTMPDKDFLDAKCPDGLRLEVLFPICWNGKDLSSADFQSHVAYSDAGANGGSCPQGYDTVINQLLFETYYPVANYKSRQGYFTLANGDPTGCGYHGDAFIAWEPGVQEAATEQCGSDTEGPGKTGDVAMCPAFTTQSTEDQGKCKLDGGSGPAGLQSKLATSGPFDKLPGDNPVFAGPEPAPRPNAAGGGPPVHNDVKANPDPAPSPSPSPSPTPSPPETPSPPAAGVGGEQAGAQDAPPAAPEPSSSTTSTASSTISSTVSSTITMTTTPAAMPPSPGAGGPPPAHANGQVLSTAYVTQGAQVLEMVYVLQVATTTVEAAAAAPTPGAQSGGPARELNEGAGHANAVAAPVGRRALGATMHEHWTRHVRGATRHNHRHGHGHGGLRR